MAGPFQNKLSGFQQLSIRPRTVSIFETLHLNQESLDTKIMLEDVMTIADECDAQLKHTVETFMELERRGDRVAA
jgi:hypothetical protein